MMGRGRMPNWMAGLLAISFIALGTYVAFGGRGPFTDFYEVRAVVRNSPEIIKRTKVRIAGVDVGEVKRMERGPGDFATLVMAIDDHGLPLHRDASLKVRPRTFLEGGFFVDLRPGTPNAPLLEEGDTIPVTRTAVPVLLGHAQADLRFDTRQGLRRLVQGLQQALDKGGAEALHDSQPDVAPAFLSLAQVAEASRGIEEHDLSRGIRGNADTFAAIASRDQQLATLVTGFNRSARALASRRDELSAATAELDDVLAEANPALGELNRLFPTARTFAAEARPGVRALPETLRLALPFLDQVEGILRPAELPALLAQGQPAITSLARLAGPLTDTFELVTPVTECLRLNAVPTLKKPVEDPPHTTGEPVYRELLHALVGFSSLSQNFDGNGPAVRYHAGFGDESISTQIPGLDEPLRGLSSEPILGSRPKFTNQLPPLRPDVPCVTQQPPDLRAETGPAPEQTSVSRAELRDGVERVGRRLERGLAAR
jgi:phospholipid/cholesterol/gamma-HCH transport system substrate-binding protein